MAKINRLMHRSGNLLVALLAGSLLLWGCGEEPEFTRCGEGYPPCEEPRACSRHPLLGFDVCIFRCTEAKDCAGSRLCVNNRCLSLDELNGVGQDCDPSITWRDLQDGSAPQFGRCKNANLECFVVPGALLGGRCFPSQCAGNEHCAKGHICLNRRCNKGPICKSAATP